MPTPQRERVLGVHFLLSWVLLLFISKNYSHKVLRAYWGSHMPGLDEQIYIFSVHELWLLWTWNIALLTMIIRTRGWVFREHFNFHFRSFFTVLPWSVTTFINENMNTNCDNLERGEQNLSPHHLLSKWEPLYFYSIIRYNFISSSYCSRKCSLILWREEMLEW